MSDQVNERNKSITVIAAASIIALAMGLGLSQVGSGFAARTSDGISVTGSARVSATADKAVWTLNASTTSPTISVAVKNVERDVTALVDYLSQGGIASDAIVLGAMATSQNYEYINGNPTGRVLSYLATRTVTVRSNDVQLINKLSNGIGLLLQNGANISNYGPAYYIASLKDLRPKLLEEAMKDAKARAEAITTSVGGSIGAVLSVRSGPFQVTSPDSVDTSAGGYYDTSTIEKTVTATVTVTFKNG